MKRSGEQSYQLSVGFLVEDAGQFFLYRDNYPTIVSNKPPTFPFDEHAEQGIIAAGSSVYMYGNNIVGIEYGILVNKNYREEYENGSVSFSCSMRKNEPSDDEFSGEMPIAVYAEDREPNQFSDFCRLSSSSASGYLIEPTAPPLEPLPPFVESSSAPELDGQLVSLAQELISDLRGVDPELLDNAPLLLVDNRSQYNFLEGSRIVLERGAALFKPNKKTRKDNSARVSGELTEVFEDVEFTFIDTAETKGVSLNGDVEENTSSRISPQAISTEIAKGKLVSWQEKAEEKGISVKDRENLVLLENIFTKLTSLFTLLSEQYPNIGGDELLPLLEQHLRGVFITADHLNIINNIVDKVQSANLANQSVYEIVSFCGVLNAIAKDPVNTHFQQTEQHILDEMLSRFRGYIQTLPDSLQQNAKCSETLTNLEFILKTTADVDEFITSFDSFITQQLEEVNRANSPDKKSRGENRSFSFATMTKFFSSKTSNQELPKQTPPQQPTPLDQLMDRLMEFKATELADLQQQRMQTRVEIAKQASTPNLD